MKKKDYISPTCEAYALPTGSLCQTMNMSVTKEKVEDEHDIGFSQRFWGLVDDEEKDADFEWDE